MGIECLSQRRAPIVGYRVPITEESSYRWVQTAYYRGECLSLGIKCLSQRRAPIVGYKVPITEESSYRWV